MLEVAPVARDSQVRRANQNPHATLPLKEADLCVLDCAPHTDRQQVPPQTPVTGDLPVVYENAGKRLGQLGFMFQEVRASVLGGLRVHSQEPPQALLLEKIGLEGVGGGDAPDGLAKVVLAAPQVE
jgi:hypothetical protein